MEEKQYYSEKRISSSSLKYFEQSPLTFKKFLDKEIELEEKSYLTKGKQIHMAILEPKLFKANYTHVTFEIPKSDQQKQFCEDYIKADIHTLRATATDHNALIEAYKNNYKTTAKDEKILELAKELKDKLSKYIEYLSKRKQFKDILSDTDWERIKDLKENCKKHKKANELLFNEDLDTRTFLNELIIFWEHPVYKLPCKSMIDRLIIDHENKKVTLIDLKTANTFADFKERCNEFGYFRQMAFYWFAINWYFINELKLNFDEYSKETYLIALKTVDDPEVKVFTVSEQQLKDGWMDITEAFTLLAWHWENDKWDYTRAYYIGDGDEKL
jgi:hypothetical protein